MRVPTHVTPQVAPGLLPMPKMKKNRLCKLCFQPHLKHLSTGQDDLSGSRVLPAAIAQCNCQVKAAAEMMIMSAHV
jgi:hypothetical protein